MLLWRVWTVFQNFKSTLFYTPIRTAGERGNPYSFPEKSRLRCILVYGATLIANSETQIKPFTKSQMVQDQSKKIQQRSFFVSYHAHQTIHFLLLENVVFYGFFQSLIWSQLFKLQIFITSKTVFVILKKKGTWEISNKHRMSY